MKRISPVVTLCLVAAFTGCSVGDDQQSGPKDGDSGGAGGTAHVALYTQPTTFSPIVTISGADQLVQQLQWDPLFAVDTGGELVPRLAGSWKPNADATQWTITLRDDVTWSDGEPITGEDVAFTFEVYADPSTGSLSTARFANIAGVAEYTAGKADSISGITVDGQTVTVDLVNPQASFALGIAEPIVPVLPEHTLDALPRKDLATSKFFREPSVGSGPYVFDHWVNDDKVAFIANQHYRDELALEGVDATFLDSDVAEAQIQTGEIDYAQISAAAAEDLSGASGVEVLSATGGSIMGLHSALESGLLGDVRVRQAIMYAIDRQALVDTVLAGHGQVINTIAFGPNADVPSDVDTYAYDPDRARELLKEAGWDPSKKVRLEIIPGLRDREQVVDIVAGQLREVGIDAEVKRFDQAGLTTAIGDRDFDLTISGYGFFNGDPSSMAARVRCDLFAPNGSNLVHYCNEDLDQLLEDAEATTDDQKRAAIYEQAQDIVNRDVPIILLFAPDALAATSSAFHGFELNPLPNQAFWNAAEWSKEG